MVIPNGITVGNLAERVFVRVVGRGTFQNSQPLRHYATAMLARGYARFTVDVGRCTGMDSTFLGVLAGIGLRLGQVGGAGEVSLVNADSRCRELLATLGLDRLFVLPPLNSSAPPVVLPAEVPWQPLPETDTGPLAKAETKEVTARHMLEAHRDLIRADERNLAKFETLTEQLTQRVGEAAAPEHKETHR